MIIPNPYIVGALLGTVGQITHCTLNDPPGPIETVDLVCYQQGNEVFRKQVEDTWTREGIIYTYEISDEKFYLSANDAAFCFTEPRPPELFALHQN